MALIRLLATKSADSAFRNVHRMGFGSYIGAVREALVNAREKCTIITPFIDNDGVELLKESWEDRAAVEVTWSIFVRKAIPKLVSLARANSWKVYEYPGSADYGTHAKIILVDSNRVILGSMNLITKNLYSNLELGVEITRDQTIQRISTLEFVLKKASKVVNLD